MQLVKEVGYILFLFFLPSFITSDSNSKNVTFYWLEREFAFSFGVKVGNQPFRWAWTGVRGFTFSEKTKEDQVSCVWSDFII